MNPVAGPYFDFTCPSRSASSASSRPTTRRCSAWCPRRACALAGNAVVVLASESNPLVAITLAEILATSDVPGGVVNMLTGSKPELGPWLAGHGDVDAIDVTGAPRRPRAGDGKAAADDVKRVVRPLGQEPSGSTVRASRRTR